MKVSLFITCIGDIIASEIGQSTVELLERVGCEVDFPENQTCCGQPAYNSGHVTPAKKAMIQMMKAFKDSDYIVGPSGSCVGMLKEYPNIFANDPTWKNEAIALANKSFELTSFLVDELKIVDVGSKFRGTVTYHPSCHMTRILGIQNAPIQLLENIPGADFIALPHREDCCGFGGTFAIKNPEISTEMVKEKSEHVVSTGAHYLVGGDMACLMNIGGRLSREGHNVKVRHISQILNDQGGDI